MSLLQLALSNGPQDEYLSFRPEVNLFKQDMRYKHHRRFAFEDIEQLFQGTCDFGQRMTTTVEKSGDLLSNSMLCMRLPHVEVVRNDDLRSDGPDGPAANAHTLDWLLHPAVVATAYWFPRTSVDKIREIKPYLTQSAPIPKHMSQCELLEALCNEFWGFETTLVLDKVHAALEASHAEPTLPDHLVEPLFFASFYTIKENEKALLSVASAEDARALAMAIFYKQGYAPARQLFETVQGFDAEPGFDDEPGFDAELGFDAEQGFDDEHGFDAEQGVEFEHTEHGFAPVRPVVESDCSVDFMLNFRVNGFLDKGKSTKRCKSGNLRRWSGVPFRGKKVSYGRLVLQNGSKLGRVTLFNRPLESFDDYMRAILSRPLPEFDAFVESYVKSVKELINPSQTVKEMIAMVMKQFNRSQFNRSQEELPVGRGGTRCAFLEAYNVTETPGEIATAHVLSPSFIDSLPSPPESPRWDLGASASPVFALQHLAHYIGAVDFAKTVQWEGGRWAFRTDRPQRTIQLPFRWKSNIGTHIIKEIVLEIGGSVISRHDGAWLDIRETLCGRFSQRRGYDKLVNGVGRGRGCGCGSIALHVPLKFSYCLAPTLALPMLALLHHEIKLHVTLRPFEECVEIAPGYRLAGPRPTLESITILNRYVFLDMAERLDIVRFGRNQLIEEVQKQTEEFHCGGTYRCELIGFGNCKEIVWKLSHPDALSSARLIFDGNERFAARDAAYFALSQPYAYHSNIPGDSTFVYSFALEPENAVQPTGNENLRGTVSLELNFNKKHRGERMELTVYGVSYSQLSVPPLATGVCCR